MFTLIVLVYGADGVGIISPTLKMQILRLREVKWFTQGHTAYKNRASSQIGLLTPNPMFLPLAHSASYVFYAFFSPKILFWTSFQSNFDGMLSNAVDMEQAAWK